MTDAELRDLLNRITAERSTDQLPGLRGVLAEADAHVELRLRASAPAAHWHPADLAGARGAPS
jgi:hypothetical protein